MPLTADAFRHAMSGLAAGVCVVTVRDADGRALGMTATSVTSLSLDPPLVLVCVGHEATIHDTIVRAPAFGVTMLAADQADVARRFAERGRREIAREGPLTPAGLPRIGGAVTVLDLARQGVLEGGDHSILVGSVEWAESADQAPLLYFRGRYEALAR